MSHASDCRCDRCLGDWLVNLVIADDTRRRAEAARQKFEEAQRLLRPVVEGAR